MTLDAWLSLAAAVIAVCALVAEVWPPQVILMGTVTVLVALGVLTPAEGLAPLGSVAVVSVAALVVVASAVRRTGAVSFFAERMLGGNSGKASILRMLLPVAGISAFLNNTPIVAMFVPVVLDWCKRRNVAPSKVLIPLSFATILGGMCTLIGTSTTLVIDGLMRDAGMEGLGMFEIGWVGLPAALLGLALVSMLSNRLLPERRDPVSRLDDHRREYLVEMLVQSNSPSVGATIQEAGLRNLQGLFLMNIERGGRFIGPVSSDEVLQSGDRLVFTGVASTVIDLRRFPGLTPAPEAHYDPAAVARRNRLFEAVVSVSSPLVGITIKDIGFRSRYDAAVLAVHRAGERVGEKLGEVVLRAGDTLMIEAEKGFDRRWANSLDFALVSRVRAEPPPQPQKATPALVVVVAMVVLAALEVLPMVVAALLAVGMMLTMGVLSARDAQRSVELSLVLVLAGALGLGKALDTSGAAAVLAHVLIDVGRSLGPLGTLAATYVCAAVLTELITNVAAAAIVFPVALAAAVHSGLDPRPFAVAVAIGSSASFVTPMGYQTNLMVYGPGGYRFTDFARLGLVVQLAVFVTAMTVIPRVWPL